MMRLTILFAFIAIYTVTVSEAAQIQFPMRFRSTSQRVLGPRDDVEQMLKTESKSPCDQQDSGCDPNGPAITRDYCVEILLQVRSKQPPYVMENTCVPVSSSIADQCTEHYAGWVEVYNRHCEAVEVSKLDEAKSGSITGEVVDEVVISGATGGESFDDIDVLITDPLVVDSHEAEA